MSHTSLVLDQSDRKLLLILAREEILAHAQKRPARPPAPTRGVNIERGAFVTLHSAGKKRRLRGCIGKIEANGSLYDTVKSMAHSAAFSDHRFSPVVEDELAGIELEISVLSPLLRVGPEDVHTGDGLIITQGNRSGLLLPQVATERNWDRETFLAQTCRKAGLPEDAWREETAEIQTFTAEVFDETSVSL